MTVDDFFAGHAVSRAIFDALQGAIDAIGQYTLRVSKSQVTFRRRRLFAIAWMPAVYLRRPSAPLVLTVALPYHDMSPRWKQVVEPAPGRFTHHLELWTPGEVDAEVARLLVDAYRHAG